MALARWKDLVLDAADPVVLGRFWAAALGRTMEMLDGGDVVLRGSTPGETIWVNAVPDPRTVKNRVHIDVHVASLEPLLGLGAVVLHAEGTGGRRWTTLADPEGGEFCAFRRAGQAPEPPARPYELVVDTTDPASSRELAAWWADVLGARSEDDGRDFWWVAGIDGCPFESIDIVPVDEPKTVKNRVHWDVVCDDVPGLLVRGATLLREPSEATPWHVLADPQGNEFCAMPSAR